MSREDLESRIREWLKNHGYPLELRTAAAFHNAGFLTLQSFHYVDSSTSLPREIDVVAATTHWDSQRKIELGLTLTVECKFSPKGLPWILFAGSTPPGRPQGLIANRLANKHGKAWLRLIADSDVAWESALLGSTGPFGYGLVQALRDDRRDPAYPAMWSSTSAAAFAIDWEAGDETTSSADSVYLQLAMPVIVVSEPLFRCSLDGAGALAIEQVQEGELMWLYPHGSHRAAMVKVMTDSYVPTYAAAIRRDVPRLLRNSPAAADIVKRAEGSED